MNNLTIDDLKKAAEAVHKFKEKPLPKAMSWFTRFMGKLGWHREYEVIFFDKAKLTSFWTSPTIDFNYPINTSPYEKETN